MLTIVLGHKVDVGWQVGRIPARGAHVFGDSLVCPLVIERQRQVQYPCWQDLIPCLHPHKHPDMSSQLAISDLRSQHEALQRAITAAQNSGIFCTGGARERLQSTAE